MSEKQNKKVPRIVILGGGFGGVYTALQLEKLLGRKKDFEIVLVNKENYFIYQPMLAEVVGGSVGLIDTVSSIRKLLPKTRLFVRDIASINTEKKVVYLAPQFTHTEFELEYDHLVLALGNVTDFRGIPGLHEHAMPFKNLADAILIRNRIIDVIEFAASVESVELRESLLTFVIGGGGFSGVEVAAELNDFARKLAKNYPEIDENKIRVVLVHSKDHLMERELPEGLSKYAEKLLKKRGVEIRFGQYLTSATPYEAIIDKEERIRTKTVISTVPSSPNPLIEKLPFEQEHGKIRTDRFMKVRWKEDTWALGDCASIPSEDGKGMCPPTAQFAMREGKTLARNIISTIRKKGHKIPFHFKSMGMLGALGHHSAVAELFGKFKFSGFFAWLMWRAIYWMKLPGFDRKIKVAVSWMLDTIIPIESVQLKITPSQGIIRLHFEQDEVIFKEGEIGDYFYIIVDGEISVLKEKNGKEECIATLGAGEFFGEMALLNENKRGATIKCTTAVNVLALRKSDFGALVSNFEDLRSSFEVTSQKRKNAVLGNGENEKKNKIA